MRATRQRYCNDSSLLFPPDALLVFDWCLMDYVGMTKKSACFLFPRTPPPLPLPATTKKSCQGAAEGVQQGVDLVRHSGIASAGGAFGGPPYRATAAAMVDRRHRGRVRWHHVGAHPVSAVSSVCVCVFFYPLCQPALPTVVVAHFFVSIFVFGVCCSMVSGQYTELYV